MCVYNTNYLFECCGSCSLTALDAYVAPRRHFEVFSKYFGSKICTRLPQFRTALTSWRGIRRVLPCPGFSNHFIFSS